jgi:IAA-amino acid hydrolase
MDILARAQSIAPELVRLRRDLHRHPELSFQEHRTAAIAAEAVAALGFTVRTGIARTGVLAELENGEGPVIALRGDMDALPIREENDHPFVSIHDGVMHACGHDAHTAGLIGAAHLLAGLRADRRLPAGTIRLLFQPSEEACDEEGKSGGMRLVEEGAMHGVDAVVGLHVGAHLPSGKVFLPEGAINAGSDEVFISVHGRSAHAARPQDGIDAVALAALGVVGAQQVVSRGLAPSERGVLTFGTIHGGHAGNVIADRVDLRGTLRYFEPEVRERIRRGVRSAFATVGAFGGSEEVRFGDGYPPVLNDPSLTRRVHTAIAPLLGGEEGFLHMEPMMEAEDFAFLSREVPGAFLWLGAALPEARRHHHPRFDIDEGVLPLGAAILARSALHLLEALAPGEGAPGTPR